MREPALTTTRLPRSSRADVARRRRLSLAGRAAVGALVGALSLSGCLVAPFLRSDPGGSSSSGSAGGGTGGGTGSSGGGTSAGNASARTPPNADLARFYSQQLSWQGCRGSGECAKLLVPVDYANPSGETIELSVLRVKARGGPRIGSLVVNPGGPGGSGVSYAVAASQIVGAPVRTRFDVVGFDPRGVGESAPIDCLSDAELDAFLGMDPTPDDAAEQQAFLAQARKLADGCKQRGGALLGHVSTVEAARDMDVLRAALDEPQLHYLGKSYGTFLGATYADLFPSKVGRFVLDGVVAPELSSAQLSEGQARGFELATRAYLQDCIDQGNCPVGDTVEEGMQSLRDLLKSLDGQPLPVTNDARVKQLTEGWGSIGIAVAMYTKRYWPRLTTALRSAKEGKGDALMDLADLYADRDSSGQYEGNIMEVIYAVNCLDRPDTADVAEITKNEEQFTKSAPTWGRMLAWGSVPCGVWPVQGKTPPHPISAKGSGPIVVVGTTRDPATIYEWSKALRNELSNAVLLTYDGDGHTAYRQGGSVCLDGPIDQYYVNGTVPQDGLKC